MKGAYFLRVKLFATLGLKLKLNANKKLLMQILVLKILVNAHNFINEKVVRDRVCSEKQTDFCVPLRKPLSAEDRRRNHQTENGCASSIQERFSESWTITVPPMKRS